MIPIMTYSKRITALQVFIIIISSATSENQKPVNYELPYIAEMNNYVDYFSRTPSSIGYVKLESYDFFKSIYNPLFRMMPTPHTRPDYNKYTKSFENSENKIDPDPFFEKAEDAFNDENTSMYVVHRNNYLTALEYKKLNHKPFSRDEYFNILALYELLPKFYENDETYYKARVEFAHMLRANTPGQKKPIKHKNSPSLKKVKRFSKESHFPNESYKMNVLRTVHNERIPLYLKKYNEVYDTTYVESDFTFVTAI